MAAANRPNFSWLLTALAAIGLAALAAPAAAAPPALSPPQSAISDLPMPDLPTTTSADAPEKSVKPVKKTRPRLKLAALPPLRPYTGAERLGLRGGPPDASVDSTGEPVNYDPPSPNIAAEPPPPRRQIKAEPDPYQPLGLKLGDVTLKPYVEEDLGYATNPLSSSTAPKGSGFDATEGGLSWQSDWSRNDFHGELKGAYTDYFETPAANGPTGSGVADLRLDATRDVAIDSEARFNSSQESLSSLGISIPGGGVSPNIPVIAYGATVGVSNKLGELTLSLRGSYDRQSYQNYQLFGSSAGPLSDDDYNDWGWKARVSYRVSEAVAPFFELGSDWRRYDNGADALGYARDSVGYAARGGVTLSVSEKLTGEASLGYGERNYQDSRLPNAGAMLVDAKLTWSPTALTTVTLKAQTTLNDSLLAGASADINHTYTIDIAHSLTRAVTLGLTGTYASDEFVGVDITNATTTLAARAEYHVNRHIVLKASASRQIFATNQAGQNYVGDVFMLGVRLQD